MFPIHTLHKRICAARAHLRRLAPDPGVLALPVAAAAALLAPPGARAAPTSLNATVAGTAQATVVRPIAVVRIADLDFGRIANADAAAGSMTLALGGGTSGAGSVTGDVTGSFTGGAHAACATGDLCPQAHAAAFAVSGEPLRSYTVTLPAGVIATATLAAAGGSGEAKAAIAPTVDHLHVRTASRPAAGNSGQLDAEGADRFEIGGRLEVPAGVEPTDYRAVIPIVVSYL